MRGWDVLCNINFLSWARTFQCRHDSLEYKVASLRRGAAAIIESAKNSIPHLVSLILFIYLARVQKPPDTSKF